MVVSTSYCKINKLWCQKVKRKFSLHNAKEERAGGLPRFGATTSYSGLKITCSGEGLGDWGRDAKR